MKNPLTSRGRHDAAADGSSAAVDDLPLPGYDRLNVGQIIARLPRLSCDLDRRARTGRDVHLFAAGDTRPLGARDV